MRADYLHISPAEDRLLGGHMLVAGLYCPEPTILRSVRDEVVDCGDELVRNIEAARGFSLDTTNRLKRNPAGFPAGSPHEELLRQKDFCLGRTVDEGWLLRPTPSSASSPSSGARSPSSGSSTAPCAMPTKR